MIADQAQGEIEVFQFQVYSVVGLSPLHFFCSTVNIKIENLRQEEKGVQDNILKIIGFFTPDELSLAYQYEQI